MLDEVAVTTIVTLALKRLVLEHKLLNLLPQALFNILEVFLRLKAVTFKLRLRHLQLPLGLVELVLQAFVFLHTELKILPVPGLEVLLNLEA